ncbi:MAG: glutamate 5-kinase, partial [Exilibacterium sp.]
MTSVRGALKNTRCWVVKVGSSLLTNDGKGLDVDAIGSWVTQIAQLHGEGVNVVLVSSGAVAAGMWRLGWQCRPEAIHKLQAAAAVGQMGLVQTYERAFQQYGLHTAQVLLDHDDLSNRERYLNARSTLRTLLKLGVVPVVNENDTVVTEEIRFGDNDTLAALVANLVEAEMLVILTDQNGMYQRDPRTHPKAEIISETSALDKTLQAMAGGGGRLGQGGMITKVRAARLAATHAAMLTLTYLGSVRSAREIALMRQVKRVFDPPRIVAVLLPLLAEGDEQGVRFERARIHSITPDPVSGDPRLRVVRL